MLDRTVPFRPIALLGGCLIFHALACSEISDPGSDGGGGTGSGARGGAAGAAGNQAGTGGVGAEGGSAGVSLDAGSDASSGAAGSGGGTVTPPGCPEPTPTAANADQKVVIQSVHFGRSEIVLKNISDEDQVIIGGRQGWQWCNAPDYWNIILGDGDDVVLGPGETYKFILIRETGQFRQLYPGEDSFDANELGIYTTTGSFMTAGLMVAFVSWGAGSSGNSRENVAGMASLWVFGERVEIAPGHAGFIATGPANRGSGYTSVPARCLPAGP